MGVYRRGESWEVLIRRKEVSIRKRFRDKDYSGSEFLSYAEAVFYNRKKISLAIKIKKSKRIVDMPYFFDYYKKGKLKYIRVYQFINKKRRSLLHLKDDKENRKIVKEIMKRSKS